METANSNMHSIEKTDPSIANDGLANYRVGRAYWEGVSGDTSGMLGGIPTVRGFSSISRIDLQGSRAFLARLGIGSKCGRKPVAKAIDGGSGIGRVTEGLLLGVAESVDVIEPVSKFTDGLRSTKGVCNIFNVGLEDWKPPEGIEYDLIWTQWCLGYVADEDVVHYLKLCKSALRHDNGVIVIKENLSTGEHNMFDKVDGSVTRLDKEFRELFKLAGLNLIKTDIQRGFPDIPLKRLLPVRMYALKP